MPTLSGPLESSNLNHWSISEGPKILDVSLFSLEEGSRFNFRNVVFNRYFKFRKMHKVHNASESELHKLKKWPWLIFITTSTASQSY